MPGRYASATAVPYRFGFNGKENDNEVKGTGNSQDYGMRIYDPRLGKFLSVDPLAHAYPWFTPYQFAGNTPISAIDLDGLENVYITSNSNRGSCMLIVYSADDISLIVSKKKPEFKVHYTNTGNETDQFEGPNKANEKKIFEAVKSLIEKSGVAQLLDDKPNDNKIFEQISANYEVPAPTPVRPRRRILPVMPSLSIDFQGSSDKFKNDDQADKIIKPLAEFLIKNPKVYVNLKGNTGVVGNADAPVGSGKDVMGEKAELNGAASTTGELMKARADAVKNYIVNKYKIDPSRISTSTGTQTQGEAGRTVGVEQTK